jgi:hypothetical protein
LGDTARIGNPAKSIAPRANHQIWRIGATPAKPKQSRYTSGEPTRAIWPLSGARRIMTSEAITSERKVKLVWS